MVATGPAIRGDLCNNNKVERRLEGKIGEVEVHREEGDDQSLSPATASEASDD